ncbi:MAG: RagB/SusD family nutrient uptake outer membrane protein [Cytophagales bacterium]|nr:RagB/SusD family nutrient uptake outer membrane protein [Cytophagales bacterium]
MKSLRYIHIVLIALILISCVDDLDVTPIDPDSTDASTVFSTEEGTRGALAKIYASFAYNGQGDGKEEIQGIREDFSNFLRQYFTLQECTTEEAIVSWDDQTIKNFHWHTWAPNDVFNEAVYSRIYFSIALANDFLRNIDGSAMDDNSKKLFRAEARFLRAFAYWVGIDMYGNIPLIDENASLSDLPDQSDRATLFAYVESELKELETLMAEPRANENGRVDRVSAWMLLAKLYLNAEVYIQADRYADAMTYIEKVIGSGYALDPVYEDIFKADNYKSSEIIFPLKYDGIYSQSHGTTFIVHASSGGGLDVAGIRGVGGTGWGGYRAVKELPEKFGIDENDFTSENPLPEFPDSRALFYFHTNDAWVWSIDNVNNFTEGIGIYKYSNLNSDGSQAENYNADFVSIDFPMFRLADAFLMYAEAFIRGGGGNQANAIKYINDLRERAYGDDRANINADDLTLDFILEERGRELYWECQRRTDLIRFGKYSSDSYVWEWKGNVKEGAGFDSHRALFPIPAAQLAANPKLVQNDGY